MNKMEKYQDMLPSLKEVVHKALQPENGQRFNFDENIVTDEILLFVLRENPVITDSNRYEWLSKLQAKASLIAQGWKLNYAGDVHFRDQSQESICQYIKLTYGLDRTKYAA